MTKLQDNGHEPGPRPGHGAGRGTGWGGQVAEAVGALLRRSTRAHLYGALTEGVAPELNEASYPVLSGLARTGPRTAAALSTELGIDRSVVSRHATRLEHAGLLRRTPDPSDGRGTLLVLTPAGEGAVAVMRERLAAAVGDYLATWDPAEAEAFVVALRRFVEHGPWSPSHDADPAGAAVSRRPAD